MDDPDRPHTWTKCFVQPGATPVIIDLVHPVTGKSHLGNKSLSEVRKNYPGAVVGDFGEWSTKYENSFRTLPVETTRERFHDMLEVLPPNNWQNGRAVNGQQLVSFDMSEHVCGRITGIYCRVGSRYFEFNGDAGQSLRYRIAMCVLTFQMPLDFLPPA